MTGGDVETMLKCENGARLTSPAALIDEIQPIGRGATMALKIDRLRSFEVSGSMNIYAFRSSR